MTGWLVTIEESGPVPRTRLGPFPNVVKAICMAGGILPTDGQRVRVQPATRWAMDAYHELAPICQGLLCVSAGLVIAARKYKPTRAPECCRN